MKPFIIAFFLTLIFCCSNLFAQQKVKETYVDKVNDFMILYPDDWSLEQGQEGEITLYSPFAEEINNDLNNEEELDSELENTPILEEKIQITPSRWDDGSLEEFVEANFFSVDWSELFSGFTIVKEGKEKINGNEAIWFVSKYNVGETSAISLFYFIKMFNKVISFTSFCKEEDFELDYKIKYLEIIRSTMSYLETERANKNK